MRLQTGGVIASDFLNAAAPNILSFIFKQLANITRILAIDGNLYT